MKEYNKETRVTAAFCYEKANHNMPRAIKLLEKEVEPEEFPADPAKFIMRWWRSLKSKGHVFNLPGRGAKSSVPPALAAEAAAVFAVGFISEAGRHRGYTSLEKACNHNRRLKELWEESGVSKRTFFEHMLKVKDSCDAPSNQLRRCHAVEAISISLSAAKPGCPVP